MIEDLILTERIETLVPLSFIICYAIAYYGPNAEILGNVKLELWHFRPVLDFGTYVKNVFVLFLVDFMSLVLNGIILPTTCNINIFDIFRNIQSEFWLIMAVQQAWSLAQVIKFIIYILKISDWNIYVYNFQLFCLLPIGSGQDYTFGLKWINGTHASNFTILEP